MIREDIEKLKENWLSDPCWDIEDTEGFEDHYDELLAYSKEKHDEWDRDHERLEQDGANQMGLSIDDYRAWRVADFSSRDYQKKAKSLLTHYFESAGVDLGDYDVRGEIEHIVDVIRDASVEATKAELIKQKLLTAKES